MQRAVASARQLNALSDILITLEHPPVLTLGRRANRANVLVSSELLARQGVALYQSNRGGDVTYHGPGQLVGYPIVNLRSLGLGPGDYVHTLEKVIIDCLREYGLEGRQEPHYVGVWVGDEKVAAIGVAVSGGVTTHGFALNVDPNLAHFRLINPCGITDKGVTSLAKLLNRPIRLEEVRPLLVKSFARAFGMEMVPSSPADLAALGIPVPSEVGRKEPQELSGSQRYEEVAEEG